MDRIRAIYGLGATGLGLLGLAVGDFALQWEPVPKTLPFHQPLAYLGALWLLAGGIACLFRRTSALGALALAAQYALWVLCHLPEVAAQPAVPATWLGVAEPMALSLGGLMGWAAQRDAPRLRAVGQRLFGACALAFGVSHFAYAKFTAAMVPAFYPFPMAWALATGSAHIAAGLSLLSGLFARLAATGLAAMFAIFVVTLHVPRVAHAPQVRVEWTMLLVALSLTGAVLNLRGALSLEGGRPGA